VKWNGVTSDYFRAKNGVKQGGVLSPVLFSVYMDQLFEVLKTMNVGCRIGNYFAGCLAYADDITLLAPTKKALQLLSDTCMQYAQSFDVKFNASKSQSLVFRGIGCKWNGDNYSINVDGNTLCNVQKAVHLGHCISTNKDDCMANDIIAKFWRSFNIFSADFGHIDPYIQCILFKQYCCSYYGAPLLSIRYYEVLCKEWRKALRKSWRLPYRTHKLVITVLPDCLPMNLSLMCRFAKFSISTFQNGTLFLKSIANRSLSNPFSIFGQNYVEMKSKFSQNVYSMYICSKM